MSSLTLADTRRHVTSSAAFRLTLRFAAIFVAALLVLGLIGGLVARGLVEDDIREDVEESLEDLVVAFEDRGAAGLMEEIARFGRGDSEGLMVGHLAADGQLLTGSLALPSLAEGWSEFLPPGTDDDESVWALSTELHDGSWLVTGASSELYHDVVEVMTEGVLWVLIVAVPLALVSGAGLSLAVMRRLQPIAETAASVGEGTLSRRAPVSARGDEFDTLSADLNRMLDRIESLNRNMRNVTVGVAHELRTPLARVRNRLTVMGDRALGTDPPRRAEIDGIVEEIDGLLATFEALLKIGQIEASAERQEFEPIDLSALIEEMSETFAPVAMEQGKELATRVAPGVTVRGNRALLIQMVSNLIENAIVHTPSGTSIDIVLEADDAASRLIVRDDGPGIPTAETERVFDRFHRLEETRPTRGNGLGLSLVRSICSLHGFRVRLADNARGSSFEVSMG